MSGHLPWDDADLFYTGKDAIKLMTKIRSGIKKEQISGMIPRELHEVYDYIQGLRDDETPDYDKIKDWLYFSS